MSGYRLHPGANSCEHPILARDLQRYVLRGMAIVGLCSCSEGAGIESNGNGMLVMHVVSDAVLRGEVGTEVHPAPRVRVTTQRGIPASDITVIFEASGNGAVDSSAVNSDAEGYATPGRWVLGTVSGSQTLSATIGASTIVFRTIASPGPLANLIRDTGDKQSGFSNDTLPERLRVRIVDRYGNGIAGEAVTFAVVAGGGRIDGGAVRTDSVGRAVSSPWTLGSAGGEHRATATSGTRLLEFTAHACDALCQSNEIAFVRGGCIYRVPFRSNVNPIVLACSGNDYAPSWSPDGQWLAFVRLRTDPQPPGAIVNWNTEVWLLNLAQRTTRRFMAGQWPSWSADGSKLAISRGDCIYRCTSFIVAVGDTTARLSLAADASTPVMSPDGTRIAYVSLSGDDGYHALHLVNADGTGFREITPRDAGAIIFPSWSPDSERLVFTKCMNGECNLHVVRADGSGGGALHQLTDAGAGRAFHPQWSPDGLLISFTLYADFSSQGHIAYLRADTGDWTTGLFIDGTQATWRSPSRP